jgi:hypothetical protein
MSFIGDVIAVATGWYVSSLLSPIVFLTLFAGIILGMWIERTEARKTINHLRRQIERLEGHPAP